MLRIMRVVLEAVAKMAFKTVLLNSQCGVSAALLDRHYFRKHGAKATYGQDSLDTSTDR